MVVCAGGLADQKGAGARPEDKNYGLGGEFPGAWDLASKMSGGQVALEVYLQWIEQKTLDMFTSPAWRQAVEAVKTALIERDTLSGEEVLHFVAQQQPGHDVH